MLVMEPDDAIRRSLCEWLRGQEPGWSISEATSKEQAIALAEAQSPRMILVDIADPRMDGLTTIREIKDATPASSVVALVMRDDETYLDDLRSAGASTSLLIWRIHTELMPTIRRLLVGGGAEVVILPC